MKRISRTCWADLAALASLATLTLVFFWQIALTNRVLAGLDLFSYFYPYRDFASSALRSGHLPLWNPYLFMGAPFLANSQAAVLYPLHWPFLWLSAPKQVAWSIVLHIWLSGAGTYLFARYAVQLRPLPAWIAGVIFALGGFLGAQVEHLNQLNASVWIPWLLLCLEGSVSRGRWRWVSLLLGGGVVALTFLAGHTQAAYVVLVGAAVLVFVQSTTGAKRLGDLANLGRYQRAGALAAMIAMGAVLSAGQLVPTIELSQLSVRSGGLPYREAASFSLRPSLIFKAFLPPLLWEPPFSEFVTYIGLVGLALAGTGAWYSLRPKNKEPVLDEAHSRWRLYGRTALALALLGVFLAFGAYNPLYYLLYRLVPGFDLFRVPARWLMLYAFGMAVLGGIGANKLLKTRRWMVAVSILLVVELFVAGRRLAYNQPTAPAAYDSMRTAPAHILADANSGLHRFLSMSDIQYDPGDMADLQAMYAQRLPQAAIYDLTVATKMKEVLAFNLPLRYRLFSVDGYDGGLLPISSYLTLERLFLPPDEIWPDGRLRQQLRTVPPSRLLSLLNVKYVITDKLQDVWLDDVFYDLEHTMPLGEVTLNSLPHFEATHLGIVSHLSGAEQVPDGMPVARIAVTSTAGLVTSQTLHAGQHTAEGLYRADRVAHRQPRIGHQWKDQVEGSDYLSVLDLGQLLQPEAIALHSLLPPGDSGTLNLRGLTLIDRRTGTSRSVSINPTYRLVHSGDVKIYENLTVQPRAFVVHDATLVANDEEALTLLSNPAFDPAREVILDQGEARVGQAAQEGAATAQVLAYEPHRIRLRVTLQEPGYAVLTDAFYPGWQAEVDGQEVPILRANLYFRAVALSPGSHEVAFRYQPASARVGLGITLLAALLWVLAAATTAVMTGRKSATVV
jgi:hypothetical protein